MLLRHVVMALLCLLVIGYALWFAVVGFQGAGAPPVRTYVDETLVLRSEGTTWTFTVGEPQAVLLAVEMPPGCAQDGSVSLGRLHVAMRPDVVYEPEKTPEHQLAVPAAGLPATRLELKHAGPYVLRLEPIPRAMGHDGPPPAARVRIRRAP